MTEKKADKDIVQTEYGFLTGNMLKGIAAVTMLIDHLAAVVLKGCVSAHGSGLSQEQLALWNTAYQWMRHIGRISFPLFAFLLVEGFYHTKSRKRYGTRLLLFALLSEVPYDLAIRGKVYDPGSQNVLFSLWLGLLVLSAAEGIRKFIWRRRGSAKGALQWMTLFLQIFIISLGAVLADLCRFDYRYKGIILMAVFYYFYSYRVSAAIAGFCVFFWNPYSLPAFLLLPFYSGRRGRKGQRWFYFFYPLHLILLYAALRTIDFFYLP